MPPVEFVEPAHETEATEGHLKFVWSIDDGIPEDAVVVFQRAKTEDFSDAVELYDGKDLGTYVSGLVEDTYYFRARLENETTSGPWSETVTVEVNYVSHDKVVGLMAAGFVVFVITVGFIVVGHLRSKEATA